MGERYFANKFGEYQSNEFFTEDDGKLRKDLADKVRSEISNLLDVLLKGITKTPFEDSTIYTGVSGLSYLYLHLHEKLAVDQNTKFQYLEAAKNYLGNTREKVVTFLLGDAGILALRAVLSNHLGKHNDTKEAIQRLESLQKNVCKDSNLPDEILYGRAGYLFALLYVKHHLGENSVNESLIQLIIQRMILSGRTLSDRERSPCPLMYSWHGDHYLGAAHGLAGIFSLLLQVRDPADRMGLDQFLKPSIDYMLTLMMGTGNGPPSLESVGHDKLVHWCHGAPGWVHMFSLAYQTYKNEKYLTAARLSADVVWTRGLLKKGYGLCHGTAGNAYTFLTLYQLTHDQSYLYKAYKFAEWCFDYGKHGCRIPDSPYSMFEGLAGTIYFLADLLDPTTACFPAHILPTKNS